MNDNRELPRDPLVSVIVPVYNLAPYLVQSMESLLRQELPGPSELILVDDCSSDGSREICRRFANEHPGRVRLVEQERNAGASAARNRGLQLAHGRYLAFLDGDDVLPRGALASLFDAAVKSGADIVKGNIALFDENQRRPAPDRVRGQYLITGDEVLATLYEHSRVRGHVGGKLFRRDRFGHIRFAEGVRVAEDLLYFSEMFAAADSLALIDAEVYDYRKHPAGSTGSKYGTGAYIDWLDAVEKCGGFASTGRQRRAHRDLLLRSVTQIARECRALSPEIAAPVIELIERKRRQWKLGLVNLLLHDRLGPRGISRYIRLRLAIDKVRRNLCR